MYGRVVLLTRKVSWSPRSRTLRSTARSAFRLQRRPPAASTPRRSRRSRWRWSGSSRRSRAPLTNTRGAAEGAVATGRLWLLIDEHVARRCRAEALQGDVRACSTPDRDDLAVGAGLDGDRDPAGAVRRARRRWRPGPCCISRCRPTPPSASRWSGVAWSAAAWSAAGWSAAVARWGGRGCGGRGRAVVGEVVPVQAVPLSVKPAGSGLLPVQVPLNPTSRLPLVAITAL